MSYYDQITKPILIQSYAVLFFVSLAFCVVIVLSSRHGFTRRAALDEAAVQSAHQGFVPRVGGLAIYLSVLGLIPILTLGFVPISLVFDFKTGEIIFTYPYSRPSVFCGNNGRFWISNDTNKTTDCINYVWGIGFNIFWGLAN